MQREIEVLQPKELVRLADLIRLSAETVRLFSDTAISGNGQMSRITELAQRIEDCAEELKRIGDSLSSEAESNKD